MYKKTLTLLALGICWTLGDAAFMESSANKCTEGCMSDQRSCYKKCRKDHHILKEIKSCTKNCIEIKKKCTDDCHGQNN